MWTGVDPATRAALANGIITAWLAQVSQFTPQQFYTGGWTTATAIPVAGRQRLRRCFPRLGLVYDSAIQVCGSRRCSDKSTGQLGSNAVAERQIGLPT